MTLDQTAERLRRGLRRRATSPQTRPTVSSLGGIHPQCPRAAPRPRGATPRRNAAPSETTRDLGQTAVTRVRELLDRRGAGSRGARGGSGSAPSSRRGAAGAAFGGGARVPSATAADESAKPKRAAKKKASAHNAKILAAASVAADLATNSGKANRQTHISGKIVSKDDTRNTFDRSRTATRLGGRRRNVRRRRGWHERVARPRRRRRRRGGRARRRRRRRRRRARVCKKKITRARLFRCVSVSSSEEDTSGDEWEDVGGDFDAYAPIAEEQEDETREETLETLDVKKKDGNDGLRRRVSPADREALRGMHQTHLLCLLARAAATDAAASDPVVRACAASAARAASRFLRLTRVRNAARRRATASLVPFLSRRRRIASRVSPSGSRARSSAEPSRKPRGVTKTRTQTSTAPERKRRRTDRNLEPLSRPARVAAADDVIVLDDDDDDDDDATRNRPNRSIPSNAFDKANDVDVTRGGSNDASSQTTLQAMLADSRASHALVCLRVCA